jgi:hypothetical protein
MKHRYYTVPALALCAALALSACGRDEERAAQAPADQDRMAQDTTPAIPPATTPGTSGDDQTVGTFTSGGTESIILAVKAARDYFRSIRPEISGRTTTASFERSVPTASTSSWTVTVATLATSTATGPPAAPPGPFAPGPGATAPPAMPGEDTRFA